MNNEITARSRGVKPGPDFEGAPCDAGASRRDDERESDDAAKKTRRWRPPGASAIRPGR